MTPTERLAARNWNQIGDCLDQSGHAMLAGLLTAPECQALAGLYTDDARYRSRIVMSRYGFGSGEYKYFRYPLPDIIGQLRTAAYSHLAPIANRWNELLHNEPRYPAEHADFIKRCHAADQPRPTPLILKYGVGDYNCLHQDLYGEHVFPLQMAILLSEPGTDFSGGEFVLTQHRARQQTRVQVIPLARGDAVIFAVNQHPAQGARGVVRATCRHGVSPLRSGHRYTTGIIFHDSR